MVMSVSVHIVCGIHIIYYVHNGVQSCVLYSLFQGFSCLFMHTLVTPFQCATLNPANGVL